MPLSRSGFEPQYEDILAGAPALGRAAVLPWDTETFGFPAASYRVEGDGPLDAATRQDLTTHFNLWMKCHGVAVCGCVIPAESRFWKSFLPALGFRIVDFAMEAKLSNLLSAPLPPIQAALREAEPEDHMAIETLAARSFNHGRYFADVLFPRELARRRFERWMTNALAAANRPDRVYVLGERGRVDGFFHVAVQGGMADLRLAAVAPELQGTGLGFQLYVSVFHELKKLGVHKLVTSISAANTAVMNIYSAVGFHFAHPEVVYHWHAARQ